MPARRRSPGGYRIPLEHLRWYAAFHRKEDSVHIHMVVFSSDPKEGYLTKQGIQQVKSAFGRRIFQQDLMHIYEQKTAYRNQLQQNAGTLYPVKHISQKCKGFYRTSLKQNCADTHMCLYI